MAGSNFSSSEVSDILKNESLVFDKQDFND